MVRRDFLLACSLIVALGAVPLMGCASMIDVMHERKAGGGTAVIYPVDLGEAWEITRTVFQWEVGEPIESHRDAGFMLTGTDADFFSWGTVMGAWVEEAAVGQTKVTVITKRRYALSLATTLTERTFHRRFAQAVAILESGESLPKEAPRYGTPKVSK